MTWALEYEELETIAEIIEKLEAKEDKAFLLSLVEKVSMAQGYRDAVDFFFKDEVTPGTPRKG